MIGYVVPHSIYPNDYHGEILVKPDLLKWFTDEYPNHCKSKLDMGKSCIHFKKPGQIPCEFIAQLSQKLTVKDWTETYENNYKR
jgi:hypothetical protein